MGNIVSVAILVVAVFSCSAGYSHAQDEDTPIKVNTTLLNVPVIVSDKAGKNVTGLKREDFKVVSSAVPTEIAYFSDAEMPLNVAIVLDVTGSVSGVLSDIKKGARQFVRQLGEKDRCMVVTFGEKVEVRTPFISEKEKLVDKINGITGISGGTALMNRAVIDLLQNEFARIEGRKAIIVLTDAGEIRTPLSQLMMDELIEGEAVVYPIYYPTSPWQIDGKWTGRTMSMDTLIKKTPVGVLHEMSRLTGGRLLVSNGNDFTTQFQTITDELKKMYVIGFYPEDPPPGKRSEVEINTVRPELFLRLKTVIRSKPKLQNLSRQPLYR
jgi:VWFA-related protein